MLELLLFVVVILLVVDIVIGGKRFKKIEKLFENAPSNAPILRIDPSPVEEKRASVMSKRGKRNLIEKRLMRSEK